MLEFLGLILTIGYIVFVWWYIAAALREYPHATDLIFKPVVVWIVLIGSALLLGIILQGFGINIFESSSHDYDYGPF